MANVIFTVPVTLLAGVSSRRPVVVAVVASRASALVEVFQAFATALGRNCSTNNWLPNTIRAALGPVLAPAAFSLASRRRRTGARSTGRPPADAISRTTG